MTSPDLANIVWHSLNGAHSAFGLGTATARRYAPGFPPLVAFADPQRPDLAALESLCAPGEHLYCGGWSGPVPAGWQLDADELAYQMVWQGEPPEADEALPAVPLKAEHAPAAQALVGLTQPGPFGERSLELGQYFGVFDAGRLVAMAGERFRTGELVEVSAVCTHPDYQGRGLARRLIERLVQAQLARGQTPFLHVMHANAGAYRLYQRMGFQACRDLAVRVVSRLPRDSPRAP